MASLSDQLIQIYSQLDPVEQAQVLKGAEQLSKSKQDDILPSSVTDPVDSFLDPGKKKQNRVIDLINAKTDADIKESTGKLGGTLIDFQKNYQGSRDKDRWLAGGSLVADMIQRMALINKL